MPNAKKFINLSANNGMNDKVTLKPNIFYQNINLSNIKTGVPKLPIKNKIKSEIKISTAITSNTSESLFNKIKGNRGLNKNI
jgi:hypothetical protein